MKLIISKNKKSEKFQTNKVMWQHITNQGQGSTVNS